MIRAGTYGDIPRLYELLTDTFQRSRYAGRGVVVEAVAKGYLRAAVKNHGSKISGGSVVYVAEEDGRVTGFILGILDRVYHVGDKLTATDLWTVFAEDCGARHRIALFDAFVGWAEGVPGVIEIKPGATDAMGDWQGAERLFQARGFRQCGVIYVRDRT